LNKVKTDEMIILVGGLGKRLRSVVKNLPKPMAPVNEQPFLKFVLDYWIAQGIKSFIFSVEYLANEIVSYFGNQYKGRAIQYVFDETTLGTGGAIRKSIIEAKLINEYVMVINGDTWYEVNFDKMIKDSEKSKLPITIALKPLSKNDRYGGIEIDSLGRITSFGNTSESKCIINGGCYLINNKKVLNELKNYPSKFSFEREFLTKMASQNKLAGSLQDQQFLDIGVPSDYKKAEKLLVK
jgi:D-glycero-alpha-D-manno-heptose 1-phosphate guanylyltransferase